MNILQAKLKAIELNPYLRDAIVAMQSIEKDEVGTAAVDKHWRMYWSPSFFETLSIDEAAGIVLHELDHLIDNDPERAASLGVTDKNPHKSMYAEVWNVAADAVINERRRREGVRLPDGAIYPEKVGLAPNMTKEQAFQELLKRQEQQQPQEPQPDNQEPGDSDEQDTQQPADGGGNQDEDSESQTGSDKQSPGSSTASNQGNGQQSGQSGQPQPPSTALSGGNGSGADGLERPWELPAPEEAPYGPDAEQPTEKVGLTPTEANQARRMAAESIKACGKASGNWSELADKILDSKPDPRKVFRKAFRRAMRISSSGSEATYRRPAKRNVSAEVIMPGKMGVQPNMCVILDTSGSMNEKDIALAMGFINKMLKKMGLDQIDLCLGDTELKNSQRVKSKLSTLKLDGRGGTNMGQLVKVAAARKPRPEAIVVITDGYTPWCSPIKIPVFAIVTNAYSTVPSWITGVNLTS